MKKVVVGLSGGVDSSVAAYMLKEQGYDVTAVFMINWHDTTGTLRGDCPWEEDQIFAELVAKKIGIPFKSVDLSDEYRKRVVDYMFDEYKKGRTPNPDVLCNREIKFDSFMKVADEMGADFVATGHYCIKDEVEKNGTKYYRLLEGTDPEKGQSYFLCQLSQQQLAKVLFPVGKLHKHEVRQIAAEAGLPSADKKDSQGICFVGKVNLPEFLQQKLAAREGDMIEIPAISEIYRNGSGNLADITSAYNYYPEAGKRIATHNGAHFYTVGQRKGLNIGGKVEPSFVLSVDTRDNVLYVGEGRNHPGLYRKGLFIKSEDIHWVRPDMAINMGDSWALDVRIRYRQPYQKAMLYRKEEGMYIVFDEPQRGIAAGQFAAWYKNGELLGSGVID